MSIQRLDIGITTYRSIMQGRFSYGKLSFIFWHTRGELYYNVPKQKNSHSTISTVIIFFQITKCAAAGRDHLPCCLRRGVPVECQALCQGTQMHSSNSVFDDCFAYIGNIMTCLEDGKLILYIRYSNILF